MHEDTCPAQDGSATVSLKSGKMLTCHCEQSAVHFRAGKATCSPAWALKQTALHPQWLMCYSLFQEVLCAGCQITKVDALNWLWDADQGTSVVQGKVTLF